jgi:hypothetical protein
MPMVLCDTHGEVAADLACPHVAQGIEGGRIVRFAFVDLELFGKIPVCEACATRLRAASTDEDTLGLIESFIPVCVRCTENWLRRNG